MWCGQVGPQGPVGINCKSVQLRAQLMCLQPAPINPVTHLACPTPSNSPVGPEYAAAQKPGQGLAWLLLWLDMSDQQQGQAAQQELLRHSLAVLLLLLWVVAVL